jgi:hypothetical protein
MKCTLLLSGILLLLSSCSKEDIGPRLKREAEEKMIGKWILERRVSEVYAPIVAHPVPGTGSSTEYTGNADDYFQFQTDKHLLIDTAATLNHTDFEVINPSQVVIGLQPWRIEELTANRLLLVWDRNDGAQNKRFITKIYLKK